MFSYNVHTEGRQHMRIPRNYYSSALLSGRNKAGGTYSLLQSALSRSSRGKRLSRSAQVLSGLKKTNNAYANTIRGTVDSQKLYYNMKYHANQVSEYGNKLSDEGAASLFAKAKETGSNTEIVANIKGFVSQYNSMLENLRESGTRTDNNYLTQLNSISSLKSSELAACGVSRQSDGTLVVDDKKLGAAGLESLEKLWGGRGGLGSRVSLWADSIENTAERSMEAKASTSYSNLFNNYGSSGNYFNFFG